jgi:hypothetical protein
VNILVDWVYNMGVGGLGRDGRLQLGTKAKASQMRIATESTMILSSQAVILLKFYMRSRTTKDVESLRSALESTRGSTNWEEN